MSRSTIAGSDQLLLIEGRKIISPNFVRKRERVFIFAIGNRSQFPQEFAVRPVTEHVGCNCNQLLPVVPFADGGLDLAQLVDDLLIAGVICHLEDIAEFLDFKSMGMQIFSAESGGGRQLTGEIVAKRY